MLYSSAFQRLAGITQIVRAGEEDIFHTRQQHSYKVAQIGRRIAQSLCKISTTANQWGLDPEVVEAACLAHDLGHPPFGHIGESVLNELVSKHDPDGFEGNAQSFRIITKLAVRFPDSEGMNLTRATLAASIKYPWHRGPATAEKKHKKWSAYRSEKEDFDFAREFALKEAKTLEAELMDWSDDVAYSVHDLEDFHRCNAIPWHKIFRDPSEIIKHAAFGHDSQTKARLEKVYANLDKHLQGNFSALLTEPYEGSREQREQLRRMTSQLIGKYIRAVTIAPVGSKRAVIIDQVMVDEVSLLKQITRDYIIKSPSLAAQQHGQRKIIEGLFEEIYNTKDGDSECPDFLPIRLRYLKNITNKTSRARFTADCIASLTEREAIGLHGRLFGTVAGSVFDPIVR